MIIDVLIVTFVSLATGIRTVTKANKGFCEGASQYLCLQGSYIYDFAMFGEYLLFESAVVIRHSHAYYQLALRCTVDELQYLLFDAVFFF